MDRILAGGELTGERNEIGSLNYKTLAERYRVRLTRNRMDLRVCRYFLRALPRFCPSRTSLIVHGVIELLEELLVFCLAAFRGKTQGIDFFDANFFHIRFAF